MNARTETAPPMTGFDDRGLPWQELRDRVLRTVEEAGLFIYEQGEQLDLGDLTRRLELELIPREWCEPADTFARVALHYTTQNALAADDFCYLDSRQLICSIEVAIDYVIASPDSPGAPADFADRVRERFGRLTPFVSKGARVEMTVSTDFESDRVAGALVRHGLVTNSHPDRFDTSFLNEVAEALRAIGPWENDRSS